MNNDLFMILQKYTLEDAIKIEGIDMQFLALKWLSANINIDFFPALVIANSLVCYQLSSKWEDYWEEFSFTAERWDFKKSDDIIDFMINFLPNSDWNKRFIDTKTKRLEKLRWKLDIFVEKEEYYYENMSELAWELAGIMNQKITDKTIVFAIKMFGYACRIKYWKTINYPQELAIPLDSRLDNLYKKFSDENKKAPEFFDELSKALWIPPLHLDAILWVNYDNLISDF